MERGQRARRFLIGGGAAAGVVLAVGAAAAWAQWGPLWAWYYCGRLAAAGPEDRASFVARLAPLGEDAAAALVGRLAADDAAACANAGWVLAQLTMDDWGAGDPRTAATAALLATRFGGLSAAGQAQTLHLFRTFLARTPREAAPAAVELEGQAEQTLTLGAAAPDSERRAAALGLGAALIRRQEGAAEAVVPTCRALTLAGLDDAEAEVRAGAVRLAAAPAIDLLDRLPPLLTGPRPEPAAEVRCLVVAALGGREEFLPTDDLLPFLHDPDGEVRAVCEQALRTRGLTGPHLQLARQLTDPEPAVRAGVPARVLALPELDSLVWLERLTRDPSPAVRAAVARAAGEARESRWQPRLRALADHDPSPTVQQIARYYLGEARGP